MKVLFVASGNSKNFKLVPFIKSQGESLKEKGIEVKYFSVYGKGLKGYLKSSKRLRLYLNENKFDIIHAHYTLCGWVAVLSRPKIPLVLSIMGSDAYGNYYGQNKVSFLSKYLTLLTYLIQPFVNAIISKSSNIEKFVFRKKISFIIPNGVIIKEFDSACKKDNHEDLDLKSDKQYVLFLGDIDDKRKNFTLVKEALQFISNNCIELLTPFPVSHQKVIELIKSVDVFVLTAFNEGSPNVIKEAMVGNCPIVATDVGDVKWVIGDTEGCYISSFEPKDFAENLKLALNFAKTIKRTNGRQRVIDLGLDSETIAGKIIKVYKKVLNC
jgi:teichuronic acid biosynthesis glycosyltransferase TuaC